MKKMLMKYLRRFSAPKKGTGIGLTLVKKNFIKPSIQF